MLTALGATAFAAPATKTEVAVELDMDMIDTSVYDGKWVTVSKVIDMYLPKDFVETTDEVIKENKDLEDSMCFACSSKKTGAIVTMMYIDPETVEEYGVSTMTELMDLFVEAGYEDADVWMINGLICGVYTDEDVDSFNVVFAEENGGLYVVSVGPQSDEEIIPALENIIASLSLPEEE